MRFLQKTFYFEGEFVPASTLSCSVFEAYNAKMLANCSDQTQTVEDAVNLLASAKVLENCQKMWQKLISREHLFTFFFLQFGFQKWTDF